MENKRLEKPSKKIVKTIVETLESKKKQCEDIFNRYIGEIKKSKDINSLMEAKQSLLREFVEDLPLGAKSCYFCIEGGETGDILEGYCPECKYGEKFGNCLEVDDYSAYGDILDAEADLLAAIDSYWD